MFAGMDLANEYKSGQSIIVAAKTGTGNGTAIDFGDCGPETTAILLGGAVSGTSPTADVAFEESDTSGGTYTAISGAAMTQVSAANAFEVYTFMGRKKRYVRAVISAIGGSSTPTVTFGVALMAKKVSY